MNTIPSTVSRSRRDALRAVLCGLFGTVWVGASNATAQSGEILAQQLDSIAASGVRENRAVGIVAAVVQGNETLLLKAYGKAVVENDSPSTVDTLFQLDSATKQFTAAAILQLSEQGKLTLEDDITKWLPDFQSHGNKVTLRHLLDHTSGIADLGSMQELRAIRLMRNPTATRDDVYKVINRHAFMFPTGTLQIYSNTNFWLLGIVIEKASGLTYEDYVEKKIFEPLGMTRSRYGARTEKLARRASGYGMRSGKPILVPPIVYTGMYAAGGICSTAEDLITWLKALHGGKVMSPKSYAELTRPAALADGTSLRYSMGLVLGEDANGFRFIGHGGAGFGFSSMTRWYPEAKLAVVVLTNSEPDELTEVTERLAAAVLPAPPPTRAFTGDTSLLVGSYKGRGRVRDMVIEVSQAPQGLVVSFDGAAASPLPWAEMWTFRQGGSLLKFLRGTSTGPATELRFDTGGNHFILKRK